MIQSDATINPQNNEYVQMECVCMSSSIGLHCDYDVKLLTLQLLLSKWLFHIVFTNCESGNSQDSMKNNYNVFDS